MLEQPIVDLDVNVQQPLPQLVELDSAQELRGAGGDEGCQPGVGGRVPQMHGPAGGAAAAVGATAMQWGGGCRAV